MKVISGDLIKLAKDGEFDIIVHGCNCFCTMGAGIAAQIASEFDGPLGPYNADRVTHSGDRGKLGSFTVGTYTREDGSLLWIVNAYTQYGIAEPGERSVDYGAVRQVFNSLASILHGDEHLRIGYPMIGAGLAGGDWDIISKIINEELAGFDHTLVQYDQNPVADAGEDIFTHIYYADIINVNGWYTDDFAYESDEDGIIELSVRYYNGERDAWEECTYMRYELEDAVYGSSDRFAVGDSLRFYRLFPVTDFLKEYVND